MMPRLAVEMKLFDTVAKVNAIGRHGNLQRGRARYFCTNASCGGVRDRISLSRWGHPCVRGRVIASREARY